MGIVTSIRIGNEDDQRESGVKGSTGLILDMLISKSLMEILIDTIMGRDLASRTLARVNVQLNLCINQSSLLNF
jgi:hypothetical protein